MNYNFYGHYYTIGTGGKSVPARSVLVITKEKPEHIKRFDLLVVMMNPGSSKPKSEKSFSLLDVSAHCLKNLVHAVPDDTQQQILNIMNENKYSSAIVINLSDIREAKSSVFIRSVSGLNYSDLGTTHSIFDSGRKSELSEILLLSEGSQIILASGVNYKLRFLTKAAIDGLTGKTFVAKRHKNGLFYHPLPRSRSRQSEWVNHINKEIAGG